MSVMMRDRGWIVPWPGPGAEGCPQVGRSAVFVTGEAVTGHNDRNKTCVNTFAFHGFVRGRGTRLRAGGVSVWLLALLAGARLGAAETVATNRAMSLIECTQQALEHNFDIKIERYAPIIAGHQVQLAYADYDPTLSAELGRSHEKVPGGLDELNRPYTSSESDSSTVNGGLSGLLPWGLNYGISGTFSDTEGRRRGLVGSNIAFVPFDSSSGRAGFMELRQPLLKNSWIDNTRYTIKARRTDLKISELGLRQQMLNTVASVEQAYYDLIAARESVLVQQKAFELARALYQENSLRVRIGVLEPLDEKEAQSQMATSETALLEARRNVVTVQNNLLNLITDSIEAWRGTEVQPTEPLLAVPQVFDAQESWTTAFENRPDLHQLILDLERLQLTTKYQRNQLFPTLDLVGTYGYAGSSTEISGSFDQVSRGSYPFHSYGVTLSFPLSNRRARQNLKTTLEQKAQAEEQLKQFRQNIIVNVENAVTQARTRLAQVTSTREAREFAETALEAGTKKHASGKIRSFEVLTLQRNVTSARSDEIRALAEYNKAIFVLRLQEGTTLKERGLEVEVK